MAGYTEPSALPIEEPKVSPSPFIRSIKAEEMDFNSAIAEILKGKKITRVDWADEESWAEINKDRVLMLHLSDGFHEWLLHEEDIVAKDWIVL